MQNQCCELKAVEVNNSVQIDLAIGQQYIHEIQASLAFAVIPDSVDVVAETFLLTCIQETAISFLKSSPKKYIALCPSRKAEEGGLFC